MAFQPLWLQNLTYPARWDRIVFDNIWSAGTLGTAALQVTQSTVPAMTVQVAAGVAVITGTDQSFQGKYLVREEAATTGVAIGAAPGSGQRNDIVGIRVRDPNATGPAGNDAVITVVAGTPSASPVDPTLPSSFLSLARVRVPAGTASITNALIDDLRVPAALTHPNTVPPGALQAGTVGSAQIIDGSIALADLAAAVQALLVPSGTISATIAASAPTGWLLLNGGTIVGGSATYPGLWAVAPAAWKVGADLVLPDWRGRAIIGAGAGAGLTNRVLNSVGGSENLQQHDHQITLIGTTSTVHTHDAGTGAIAQAGVGMIPGAVGATSNTGTGSAQNMQPWAAANLIVKG